MEISKEVVAGCEYFSPWNNNVLADSRSHLIVQDGRSEKLKGTLELRLINILSLTSTTPMIKGCQDRYQQIIPINKITVGRIGTYGFSIRPAGQFKPPGHSRDHLAVASVWRVRACLALKAG